MHLPHLGKKILIGEGTGIDKAVKANNISIVLAEELSSTRLAFKSLFEEYPDLKVIGEVNNGLDALDLIGSLLPDILVLGLTASNTLEIVKLINQRFPKTGIIVPYKPGNDKHVQELLRNGVKACILKTSSRVEFIRAIREWGKHHQDLSTPVYRQIQSDSILSGSTDSLDAYQVLTPREREVFNLVVRGLTNVAIAAHLSISRRTVEVHRYNLLRKLGLHNQQEQLINYANERGIHTEG